MTHSLDADNSNPVAELVARIARVEARLDAIEGRPAQAQRDGGEAQPDGSDPFWALHELERRNPRPAVLYTGHADTPEGPVSWQVAFDSAELTDQDWTTQSATLAALGHPSRLQILQLVARGEARTAADLAHAEGLGTTGQIYHHLRQLVSAGWLRSTTKGQHVVPPERVIPLLVILGASQ
jgi:hypothetical protein